MNTNRSRKGTIVCGVCAHENPSDAKLCQNCGTSLIIRVLPSTRRTNTNIFDRDLLIILGTILVLFAGAIYYLSRQFYSLKSNNEEVVLPKQGTGTASEKQYVFLKDVPNVPTGVYNYGGAPALSSLNAQGLYNSIQKAQPNFTLAYTKPWNNFAGSNIAINMLINSQLSFAVSSKPIDNSALTLANKRGFSLQQIPIAIDGYGCYTSLDISIPGLTVGQLQAIYQGKITNWKQVGGPNLEITPIGPSDYTAGVMKTLIPEGAQRSPKLIYQSDYTGSFRKVTEIPGAISVGSVGLILAQSSVHPIALAADGSNNYVPPSINGKINAEAFRNATYPLTRRIFVIVRRDGTLDEKAGRAYANLILSQEGQQFVEKAGMVPIQPTH